MADNSLNSREIAELKRLVKALKEDIDSVSLDRLIQSGSGARSLLERLRNEFDELNDDISIAASNFSKMVDAASKIVKPTNEVNKAFNSLNSIASKIQAHQKGISELTEDELEQLQKQAKYDKDRLTSSAKILKDKKSEIEQSLQANIQEGNYLVNKRNLTEEELQRLQQIYNQNDQYESQLKNIDSTLSSINRTITVQGNGYGKLLNLLQQEKDEVNKINTLLGLSSNIVEGVNAAFNKLGFSALASNLGITEAKNEMENTAKSIALAGGNVNSLSNKFKVLNAGISSMGASLKTNLTNPLNIAIFLGEQLAEALKISDTATGDLAKQFDLTYQGAANVRNELNDIANFSNDAAVTTKGLQESMVAIGQSLGTNAMLNQKDLVFMTKMREQAGYTNEELVGIGRVTLATGGTLEKNSKTFLGTVARLNAQNKLSINAKQLFKEVANVSDAIKLSVGGTTEKLAEATFKARQFGINLEQADRISESLLNFESSIANELSAELLTGKDLNFERARLLAINGDIAGASAEILKQVGGTAEFTKMNRIQQEAIAKSVGMTRDDLAKSLVDREAAAKLGAKEGQAAQDRYNELVKQYGVEKANAMLGDEALQNQFQQQSIQDRFNQSVEKLKDIFVAIAEPILQIVSPFVDLITTVLPTINLLLAPFLATIKLIGRYANQIVGAFLIYKGIQMASNVLEAGKTAQLALQGNALAMQNIMLEKSIVKKGMYHAIALREAYTEQGIAGVKAYASTLDEKSLARKVIISTLTAKEYIQQKAIAGFELLKVGYQRAAVGIKRLASAIEKGNLLKSIGSAMMGVIQSLSSIPVVGWALGLTAAAGVAALGYKFMTGDDVMSEGGYGNRTLLTPKGSIALNNNDTVIAGTNLGGKGKSSPPQQDNSALLNEMKAMRQEQARANSKPTIVENSMNGTKFGTSVAMNTYKIQ